MAKSTTTRIKLSAGGGVVVSSNKKTQKSSAASTLAQRGKEATKTSRQVLKEVSSQHHDALKRLVDR
jgi:RNA 3'-terminal phosphate cyclase